MRMLCVGGPNDGQWLDVDEGCGPIINVPSYERESIRDFAEETAISTVTVTTTHYKRQKWIAAQREYPILVPVEAYDDPAQALELLLIHYRPPKHKCAKCHAPIYHPWEHVEDEGACGDTKPRPEYKVRY
jgi:hypothetical protein